MAYKYAKIKHSKQKREEGSEYIFHPLAVAKRLASLGMNSKVIAAALLHDVLEDTDTSVKDLKKRFGRRVAKLVNSVTKIRKAFRFSRQTRQNDNLKKMFFAMSKSEEVVMLKLIDRLHNLESIHCFPRKKGLRICKETIAIYVPICELVGMFDIKFELENLCLKTLDPETYDKIKRRVVQKEESLKKEIESISTKISKVLANNDISAVVEYRVKSFYSLYKKMIVKNKNFSEIYDFVAIRVITENKKECYVSLGLIHQIFKPIFRSFKDYIAIPKLNGYCSIHSVVISKSGLVFETQIRTKRMHEIAEYGIASHYNYKIREGSGDSRKNVLDVSKNIELLYNVNLSKKLKFGFITDKIYVFTGKACIVELPKGATALDFVCSVDENFVNDGFLIKVNGIPRNIDYRLKNGDVVDFFTKVKNSESINMQFELANTFETENVIRQRVREKEKRNYKKYISIRDELNDGFFRETVKVEIITENKGYLLTEICKILNLWNVNLKTIKTHVDNEGMANVILEIFKPVKEALLKKIRSYDQK